jgi:PAS domain S-box-containing protein
MRNQTFASLLRTWLDDLPIHDPVDRRMAALLQFILLGFIAITLLALVLNPILGSALSPQELRTTMAANSIGVLVFALPWVLLRRGYFRASVLLIIGILFILTTLSLLLAMSLREANGTLFPLTLAMILAGLLVGGRALLFTLVLSVGVLFMGLGLEQSTEPQVRLINIAVAGNFILFNSLMCLFLYRFGITLRTALTAAYQREDELKNVIRERELAEEKYSKIVENAIDGIFQSTPDGRFLSVNPAMARMYGYKSPEEMLDSITNISSQIYVDAEQRDNLQHRLSNGEQILGFEALEFRKDRSTLWTSTNIQSIRAADGNILYYEGTVEDITPRKKVEADRESLIQELAAKNAELERFTYTVSHDLKSPLVTINGFLGYLEQDAASGNMDRFKVDSQRIHDAVDKMQGMLNELLELSRIGRLVNDPENIPFEELVQSAMELVHGQIEAGGITISLQPNLPAVYGDRQRLTEVLQNLMDNASKFMGNQTNPHIEIGQDGKENGKTVFYVRDNGIGIEPDYHEHIFGLFNKLDSKAEGTGIGLALVRRIVEVHGGRIWVESEAGAGSTFLFTLPQYAPPKS